MRPAGRPLRFLGAVGVGWVGVRSAMLWPSMSAELPAAAAPLPIEARAAPRAVVGSPSAPTRVGGQALAPPATALRSPPAVARSAPPAAPTFAPGAAIAANAPAPQPGQMARQVLPLVAPDTRPAGAFISPAGRHWWASGWLLVRSGGTQPVSGLTTGMLGGSQAGVRIGYRLGDAGRLSPYARVSAALSTRGREAALGLDWQPTRLPIHLLVEQRLPFDGGRGGPTLGVVGGAGPVPLPADFRLEIYGQGGVILRDGGVAFADGAARLHRRVARAGAVQIALGGGVWGGAQPGAARFDLGPGMLVDLPVEGRHLRLSVDWRERLAGAARPSSGLAITLGADF